MGKVTKCTIDSGWVGSNTTAHLIGGNPQTSIVVEEGEDKKLLDFIQDGEWYTSWRRDVVGFTR